MKTIEEIKENLDSDDIAVLNLCNIFLDKRIERERLRAESAEKRASILLGIVGAASALLVFLSKNILSTSDSHINLIITFYIASVLWLFRTIWYSLKSIRTQNRYCIDLESIFEFQQKTKINALKAIISAKLWEYKQSVRPNTERLFYIQRAQRALVVFIGLLLMLGFIIIIDTEIIGKNEFCFICIFSTVLAVFWFFGYRLIEKLGIWDH